MLQGDRQYPETVRETTGADGASPRPNSCASGRVRPRQTRIAHPKAPHITIRDSTLRLPGSTTAQANPIYKVTGYAS